MRKRLRKKFYKKLPGIILCYINNLTKDGVGISLYALGSINKINK